MQVFYGKSHNQQFVPDNKRAWAEYLLSIDGKALVVQIDQEKWVRSASQNNYLWGVVYRTIANSTGSTETELHEIFKRMFLPPQFVQWKEAEIKIPGSTSKLDKAEFGEYIERIRAEVANIGITIPDPT